MGEPRDLRASAVRWRGRALVVLSYELPRVQWPEVLSEAERAVADLAIAGLSNAEIARRRRVARRTVENQLARIFAKLGVRSRGELALAARKKYSRDEKVIPP